MFYVVVDLGLLGVVGIVLAVPAVLWCIHDMRAIPHRVWFWSGHDRRPWYWALGIGWVLGGYGAVIVALVWSRSAERRDLYDELADLRERAHSVRVARRPRG